MNIRAALLAVAFGFGLASAAVAAPAPEGTVDMTELLKAAPLPELAMGPETGVTVIEYGSVTCPHCAAFDKTVLPKFKAAYVDTGKARYIFREFSRNALDVAAFTLARCVGDDKAMATIELLFSTQDKWAFTDNPLEPLLASLRPTGLSHDKAMACLKDNTEINKVRAITETAEKLVKVQGTPTFVIDGKVYGGELTMDDFDQILKPLIK
jgi:protein-disulfide isomerase